MNDRIPCDIIQDLLPLYADGLTRETVAQKIQEHLEGCISCRESYDRMRSSAEGWAKRQEKETAREIDYLKTVKKRNIRNIILGIGAAFLVITAAIGVKLFITGSPSESYVLTYLNTDQEQIYVGGTFVDSASVYAGHKLVRQPDGTGRLVIYSCLSSPWNRNGVFNISLDLERIEGQTQIGGALVTADGTVISPLANELYQARNPYIGDASADGRLAGVLGIGRYAGPFTNELQTSREPYGWTLNFQDSVRNSLAMEASMKDYASVLLALTDNLGEVEWTYTVETEAGPIKRRGSLTEKEASEYLGAEVKSFGESPGKVQKMLEMLGMDHGFAR